MNNLLQKYGKVAKFDLSGGNQNSKWLITKKWEKVDFRIQMREAI